MPSCKETEKTKPATVSLQIVSTTATSIEFEIAAENAVSVSYAVERAENIAGATYETEMLDGRNSLTITEEGLEEGVEYVVSVYATSPEGLACDKVEKTAATTIMPSVSVENVEVSSNSVSFELVPLNAVSMSYIVTESSAELETVELSEKIESGSQQKVTKDGLAENTNYTIVAAAANSEGAVSERVYYPFKTSVTPVISIESIVADVRSASVTVKASNSMSFSYACAVKGEPQPEDSRFRNENLDGDSKTVLISQLEPETEYTLYVYSIGTKNNRSEIVTGDFETKEYVPAVFEILVSNVTSTDATIDVKMDKEIYSKYYFVVGPRSAMCPEGDFIWDWENYIGMGFSNPQYGEYSDDMTFSMRMFAPMYQLEPAGQYMAGGIPVRLDGSYDHDMEIWEPITLPEIVFDESDISVTVSEENSAYDNATFKITASDPDLECIYVFNTDSHVEEGTAAYESIRLSAICSSQVYMEGGVKDTTITWLQPGYDYTLIVLAKDKDGKIGKANAIQYSTKSLDEAGDAEGSASLVEVGTHEATFNITLGSNAVGMAYNYAVKDMTYSETALKRTLVVGNPYPPVTKNGEFEITGLSAEKNYVFAFAPLDEKGVAGEVVMIEASTKAYEFAGNPEAKVAIDVTSCQFDGYASWEIRYDATPNEFVSKFYVALGDDMFPLSASEFADQIDQNWHVEYRTAQKGIVTYLNSNGYILAAPFDLDGVLAPIEIMNVEETRK